ncbi:MAG: MarR family winged helix-turn-helix transcriptional regulator [Acidimicrobiales bacterium]
MEREGTTGLDECEMGAWRALVEGSGRLLQRLNEELLAAHGLNLAEYEVLSFLSEAPGGMLRMSALARRAVVSRSGLTRRVDQMVASGLLRRRACPSDRRGTFAELTEEGWERLREAAPSHREGVRRHFLAHLDREELVVLAEGMGAVAAALAPPATQPAGSQGSCR